MKVYLDVQSIQSLNGSTITGIINVEHNGLHFPGASWNDIVDGVMEIWGAQLTRLHGVDRIELIFMDGPQRIKITRVDKNALFHFVGQSGDLPDGTVVEANLREFVSSYLVAARELINHSKGEIYGQSASIDYIRGHMKVLSAHWKIRFLF